ncbi:Peptidase family M49 [Wenzhouxiangella marina]|uniref:Peptidase family M49 n=2 Tax=Wenzhouxiangella marina TaxID=1579979 RepID=A0A0K0XWB3_9GAMM|nr:Peptidase family M49 [Wenzhouxiangella marina]
MLPTPVAGRMSFSEARQTVNYAVLSGAMQISTIVEPGSARPGLSHIGARCMKSMILILLASSLALALAACGDATEPASQGSEGEASPPTVAAVAADDAPSVETAAEALAPVRPGIYSSFRLDPPVDRLSENEQRMVGLLIDAAAIMDALFWKQAFGDPVVFLAGIDDPDARRFAEINYGPWDRLAGNQPFLPGFGPKPAGANYYPADMSDEEFEAFEDPAKLDLYTLIRRDEAGDLEVVPYHEAYAEELEQAAALLRQAAELSDSEGFADYLRLRAEALVSDDYQPSDMAWMDVRDNNVEIIIGAIETYEDQRYGAKAGYEAYVMLKDHDWSQRLSRYAALLPALQEGLPVPEAYRAESPGTDSDLNAYDMVYYAGHSNAGSKTIAVNLPNDEEVQLARGTRRLQLKNAMRAKFDAILEPLAEVLIAEDQRRHIQFDAFFGNTMFHEVAHGLGIKNTINGQGTVREALREHASPHEEGKADVLGLYMVRELLEQGEMEGEVMDYYVTFLAGIFRSVRFGAASAHGRANMMRFNYFADFGAFERDENGHYRVIEERFSEAVDALSRDILVMQGDGDYERAGRMLEELGRIGPQLQADLDRIDAAGIPVDVVFEQGHEVVGF